MLFVAGFGPIVPDAVAGDARQLYGTSLALPIEGEGDYLHTGDLAGVKHFALWPLSQAAEACFGTATWPGDLPIPQAWLEFDVDDVASATQERLSRGYRLLVQAREEPWGQTVTRLLAPEGLLVGSTYTPWMRGS